MESPIDPHLSKQLTFFAEVTEQKQEIPLLLRALPIELLLDIFEECLTSKDLKALRLVSRAFAEIASPLLFETNLNIAFKVPKDYYYCAKHGWYLYTGPLEAYNLPPSALMTTKHSGCQFQDSPAADSRLSDEDRECASNPLLGPIVRALNGGLLDLLPMARELSIKITTDAPKGLPVDEADDLLAFAECMPDIFDCAGNLQTVHVTIGPGSRRLALVNVLEVISGLCEERNIDLHVTLSFEFDRRYLREECLRALSSIASLDLYYIKESLTETFYPILMAELIPLLKKCPRILEAAADKSSQGVIGVETPEGYRIKFGRGRIL